MRTEAQKHDPPNVDNPQHVDHDEIMSPGQQMVVFAVLLLLTLIMVLTSYVNLGLLNPFITIGSAFIKAGLVIWFFMHVRSQSRLIQATIASGFFILLVLVVMSGSDYISRAWGLW